MNSAGFPAILSVSSSSRIIFFFRLPPRSLFPFLPSRTWRPVPPQQEQQLYFPPTDGFRLMDFHPLGRVQSFDEILSTNRFVSPFTLLLLFILYSTHADRPTLLVVDDVTTELFSYFPHPLFFVCVCDAGSLFFSFVFLYRHAPRVSPSLFFIHRLRFGFLSEVVGCRRRYRKKKAAFIEKKDFLLDFRPPPLLRPYGRDNRNERNKGPPLDGSLRLYSRVSLSLFTEQCPATPTQWRIQFDKSTYIPTTDRTKQFKSRNHPPTNNRRGTVSSCRSRLSLILIINIFRKIIHLNSTGRCMLCAR